jgi:hypothetical protein
MRPRRPVLRVSTPTCWVLPRTLLTAQRELLLLMLPVPGHRHLLRPLRPLRLLRVLAGLVLRLLRRLVVAHDE